LKEALLLENIEYKKKAHLSSFCFFAQQVAKEIERSFASLDIFYKASLASLKTKEVEGPEKKLCFFKNERSRRGNYVLPAR